MPDIYMNINGDLVDREARRRREKASKHKNKLKAMEFLGGECKDCGVTLEELPMCCFDIDHVISENKKYNFASIMKSWKKVKAEIDNCECELVCKNCHAIRTRDQAQDPEIKRERQKALIQNYRNQHNREEVKKMYKDKRHYEVRMIPKEEEESSQAALTEWS